MSEIEYYRWGKEEKPLAPPQQKQCKTCAAVQSRANLATFDTERDAQVAFGWGGLKMVNDTIKALWTPLWNAYKCVTQDCAKREACANTPSFIKVIVHDITVVDATAPMGKKQVWQLTVVIQRKIKCVPGETEHDVPAQPFKDELPPSVPDDEPKKDQPKEPPTDHGDSAPGIKVEG